MARRAHTSKLSRWLPANSSSLGPCPMSVEEVDHTTHHGLLRSRPSALLGWSTVEPTVELTPEEQRVIGCLIEKGATTPDAYPLTMNALVAACNQTSNRDPIVSYGEATVTTALTSLRERRLIR